MFHIPRVRIVRNKVGFRQAVMRLSRLTQVLMNVLILKPYANAERERLAAARLAKIVRDTAVQELRGEKLREDITLRQLQIKKLRQEIGEGEAGGYDNVIPDAGPTEYNLRLEAKDRG